MRFRRVCVVCVLSGMMICRLTALEADLSIARFLTPDKAYMEFFLYVLAGSVTVESQEQSRTASVNVTYFITQDEDVIAGDRYNLMTSGEKTIPDFMDLRRHVLDPGAYVLRVELTDNLDTTNTLTLTRSFVITPEHTQPAQSDIRLLAQVSPASGDDVWVRGGSRMTPLPFGWSRSDMETLYFYHEIYHSDIHPATDFFITYKIVPESATSKVLLQGHKRMKPRKVNTVLQAIDISSLASGEYLLYVTVFDQGKNALSDMHVKFIRSNPAADVIWEEKSGMFFEESFTQGISPDTVRYALRALAPRISQTQVPILNALLDKGEEEHQRRYLHQYWIEVAPLAPGDAYREYMQMVAYVDKKFHAAFGRGFESDRGHILLKYGLPDDMIAVDDEPSAPPYEIWVYHSFPATRQTNVRFLFYNPSLAGGDYRLLHSTATGELRNPRWQQQLYGRAITEQNAGDFIDARDVRDNFHRRAMEYFND